MTPTHKRSFAVAVAVALLMAIPIGLLLKRVTELEEQLADERSPVDTPPAKIVTALTKSTRTPRPGAVAQVVSDVERWEEEIASLDVDEFAAELSKLLNGVRFPADMAKAALMLRAMDTETAIATYRTFKEAQGLGLKAESQRIRELMTVLGEKEGREGLEKIYAAFPEGFHELSSYMYGWTQSAPEEAVAYLNAIEDDKLFRGALKGVFWSAGVSGPQYAVEAFELLEQESMEPQLLTSAGHSVASALMSNHGTEGVEEWVQSLPEEMQSKAIGWALDRSGSQPVSDTAQWLAGHAHRSDDLMRAFANRLESWANANADAAIAWAAENEQTWEMPGLWQGLTGGPKNEQVNAWVEQNPTHPAAEVFRKRMASEEPLPRLE